MLVPATVQAITDRRRLAALLSGAAAPASAAPSTRAERVAAANAFAQRTLTFERDRDASRDDALRALAARRASAQDCLAVWRAAPPARRGDLGIVYFEYLSGALWSVDAPLYRGWITDLRRSRRIDRSPVLARAADALRRRYVVAHTIYTAVPDACATVTRWRDAGWSDGARPAVLAETDKLAAGFDAADDKRIAAGASQLVRYARGGLRQAAEVVRPASTSPTRSSPRTPAATPSARSCCRTPTSPARRNAARSAAAGRRRAPGVRPARPCRRPRRSG